jgi:hypothetical protein
VGKQPGSIRTTRFYPSIAFSKKDGGAVPAFTIELNFNPAAAFPGQP